MATENKQEKSVEESEKKTLGKLSEKTIEKQAENLTEKPIEKSTKKYKKIALGFIISLCTLLIIYLGLTKYFTNHFYLGSEINSVNVSGDTVESAKSAVESKLQNYTLNLKERGGKSEQVKASDIDLKCTSADDFKALKNNQNPFKWVSSVFNSANSKMTVGLSYNKELFTEQIDKLSCFNADNVVEPKNPSFKYENSSYVIVNEVQGNKVNKSALCSNVVNSLLKGKTELDLESANCYINPKYTSKSKKAAEDKDTLNKYVSSKITYNIRGNKETIDGSEINKWLTVDDDLNVTFDEKSVKAYINTLSNTYDTVGKTRTFATSVGNTVSIGGGDYGWSINTKKETQNLISYIKEGKTVTKEPVYSQTAVSNGSSDIGNTYVEINLSKQHVWFYKNGSLVVQGDVVTGNVSINDATPTGIYYVKYKERNATLKGQGYASPVSFWMPFNGGIGLHDATWRSTFGGNIYLTNGSHGCVNCPCDLAQTIFQNIDAGTPVVVYNN